MKINNKPLLIMGLINWLLIVILAVVTYLLISCTMPEADTKYVTISEPGSPVIPVELGNFRYITYNGQDVNFVYENDTILWKTGKANYWRPGIISVDDVVYFLDSTGNVIQSYRMPCIPDTFAVDGSDVYSAITDGVETRIYLNSELYNTYPWIIDSINITRTGDIVAWTAGKVFVSLAGTEQDIKFAANNGLYVFDLNTTNKTATFRGLYDYHDGWGSNYFWRATGWQLSNGLWISSNGYTWNAGGLTENANSMYTWNQYPYPVQDVYNESPVIIPATVRVENSEDVTYWIECNTGYLIRFTPSLDLIEIVIRLYPGDGMHVTGYGLQFTVKPSVIGDKLYYHQGGYLYEYDFTADTVLNMGTDMQIWGIN